MKKITFTGLLLFFFTASFSQVGSAPEKLSEKTLIGKWKMVIEMDQVVAELNSKAKESDNVFAEVLLSAVSGVMQGVSDKVSVYLDFKSNKKVYIKVNAFDEGSEEDDTEWYIKDNRLFIKNTDKLKSDGDNYWTLKDGILYLQGQDKKENVSIYLVRIN